MYSQIPVAHCFMRMNELLEDSSEKLNEETYLDK